MADGSSACAPAFLHPGEVFTAEGPVRVKTVLGSCVAIVLRAPRLGLAAMAHCLLPRAGAPAAQVPTETAWRYVDTAIELMMGAFASRGVARSELEVKLFGGAGRWAGPGPEPLYQVGTRNVEVAERTLAAYGLHIAASDTGGRRGRVIEWDTATGEVLVKRLPSELRAASWEES